MPALTSATLNVPLTHLQNVTNQFTALGKDPRITFLGNVHVGKDVSLAELRGMFHGVVLAYGAESDRRLGIPGEVRRARELEHRDMQSCMPCIHAYKTVGNAPCCVRLMCTVVMGVTGSVRSLGHIGVECISFVAASPNRRWRNHRRWRCTTCPHYGICSRYCSCHPLPSPIISLPHLDYIQ